MKILLTTLNSKYVHSNLAIRYLRSYCSDLPVEIILKEFNINQNRDYILAEIYKSRADLIAFSCYIWNISSTLQLCSILKQVMPQTKIILGGPEVSFDPENLLQEHSFLDFIIRDEGEESFRELLLILLQEGELGKIAGVTYQQGQEIISGPDRPLIADLDHIPSPFTDRFDEYANKLIYYESSRGCPFNCQYCLSSTLKGVRTFSMKRIQNDLLNLINAGVKKVKFVDRTFNFNSEHALQIMRFLLKHRKNTAFHFEITAHLITDEMLEFLRQVPAGLFQFEIGVQSTNYETLKQIRRKDDFNRLSKVVHVISEYQNIRLHLDLIAGLPAEDYHRFQQSFNDVFKLRPDKLQLGFLKLLKGSGIRKDAEQFDYKYLKSPPYEILENSLISYHEILELKLVEDVLETYYNSHKFELSVDFLIKHYYSLNPFLFFKELKDFWEKEGFQHAPKKDAVLYKLLLDFYQSRFKEDISIFREYLKFDFLRNFRISTLPEWLYSVKIENYKNRCYQFVNDPDNLKKYLPHYCNLEARSILRKILIIPFRFDIFALREEDEIESIDFQPIFVLFDYDNRDPIFNHAHYQMIKFKLD